MKKILLLLGLFFFIFIFYQTISSFKLLQMPYESVHYGIKFSDLAGTYTYKELLENNIFRYTRMSDMRKPFSFYELSDAQSNQIENLLSEYSFKTVYYDSTGSGNIHYPDESIVFSYTKHEDESFNFVYHGDNMYTCGIHSLVVTSKKVLISKRIFLSDWIIEQNKFVNEKDFKNEILISYECSDKQLLSELNKIIEEIKNS